MPQSTFVQGASGFDYTPAVDLAAGAMLVVGKLIGVTHRPIPANTRGFLYTQGIHDIVKSAIAIKAGDEVCWNPTGDPQGGVAGSGAATTVSEGNTFIGFAVADAAVGDTTVRVILEPNRSLTRVSTPLAASSAITNTIAETEFDKSYTFPANSLKVGDVLKIRAQVIAPLTNATDTLNIKLKLGAAVIVVTGALDVNNNDIAYIDATVVIRSDGAGGTMVAAGMGFIGTPGTAVVKPFNLASTAIDTTVTQKVALTATWSVANAGNSCRLDLLQVERLSG